MPLCDKHFEAYLRTLEAYRITIMVPEMVVMNSCLKEALESSMVTPMSVYIWKKRKVFDAYRPVRGLAYKYMEEFCKLYNWDYQLMEDKWEDLNTDP
jgi:hypothetical protein